jgi:hypothetical protein
MPQKFTLEVILAILAAIFGSIAIMGLMYVILNRFRQHRKQQKLKKNKATSNKHKHKKKASTMNGGGGSEIYTNHADTYSVASQDGPRPLRTADLFYSTTSESMSQFNYHNESRQVQSIPASDPSSTNDNHHDDDFDDVWSFVAVR